jgi:1,4-dihydroxy-2-naphthoate octaprenyltransferase
MQKTLRLFYQVTRARTLPMIIAPIIVGAVFAWQQGTVFRWELFLLTLVGALAAHLAANVTNDIFDFAQGTDQAAQKLVADGTTVVTGSQGLLQHGFSLWAYRRVALLCFALALLCGLLLTFFRPWTLLFAVPGFLLAFFYVAPPLRLAYIGRGVGEVDILCSFGILPVLGSYYIQAGNVAWNVVLAALPIGLYTTTVLYFHHFLHWQADKVVGKMTPIVVLGTSRARMVGVFLVMLIACLLILDVFLQIYPWYSIVAVLTIMPVTLALKRATGELQNYTKLLAIDTSADLQAAFLLVVAMGIHGIFRL